MTRWTGPRSGACIHDRHNVCTGCEGCDCHTIPMPGGREWFKTLVEGYAEDARVGRYVDEEADR